MLGQVHVGRVQLAPRAQPLNQIGLVRAAISTQLTVVAVSLSIGHALDSVVGEISLRIARESPLTIALLLLPVPATHRCPLFITITVPLATLIRCVASDDRPKEK